MKHGWVVKKLNEISENLDSKRVPITKNIRSDGKIPYYGASGIVDYVAEYLFDEDLLCVSEDGANLLARTYPIAFSITGKTWVNNHAHVLKFENLTTQKFVELYLNSIKLDDFVSGMAQPKLNQTMLNKIPISLPPLPEQQRIVGILDEVFDGIAKAKANAEQNLKNAQELFESYLQSVFETKGEGWEEKTLGEVVVLIDSLHRTPSYQLEGYPMVRVTDIKTGFLSLDKTKKVDRETFDEFSKKHIPKVGDIVLARVGSYGVSSIVNSEEPFCLGQNTVFILPKINSNYVYFFLNSPYAKKQLDKMVAGTTQPTISLKSIKEVSIPLPNLIDQQTIVQKLDALSLETKKLETIYLTKITDLEELKKSILHKAFNGELK